LPLNDLISEGNLGLIKAAKRFDETKGFKFISYAVWWIRQGIMQAIAEQSRMVRLPLNQVGAVSRLYKTFSNLEQEHERDPSVEELAEAMESTAAHVADVLSVSGRHLSIDAPFKNEEQDGSLLDVLAGSGPETDDSLMKESRAQAVRGALAVLAPREREIIILFYGLDSGSSLSLEDIGFKYGLTRERVRQLRDKALLHLRGRSSRNSLQGFLE